MGKWTSNSKPNMELEYTRTNPNKSGSAPDQNNAKTPQTKPWLTQDYTDKEVKRQS